SPCYSKISDSKNMNTKRYPLYVKFLGLVQHEKQKAYILSVLWSDQNDVIIYRTFHEFRKLHKELQRKFPIAGGLFKKSESVLPKFKDVPVKLTKEKGAIKSMLRLKLLEKYSSDLLEADSKVSQCEDVFQFFLPKTHDLKPSFNRNSIVILPSVTEGEKDEMKKKRSANSISKPVVSEIYKCVEAYETKDTKNRPFTVNKDDILDVIIKDHTEGWWLVENEEKHLAWFPAPYLEKRIITEKDGAENDQSEDAGMLYYTVKGYDAKSADELSFNIGVVVEVLQKSEDGWWLIHYNEKNGYVPSMYLQPYKNPHVKFQVLLCNELCVSTPNLYRPISSLDSSESETPPGHLLGVSSDHTADRFQGSQVSSAAGKKTADSGSGSDSDSSTYKKYYSPNLPRVPPRPNSNEILKRCTTITKKAVIRSKGNP
uniref:NADPH oxidase organizer 1 n=1 Tax=Latimeria chalumnae TaxID=7897 RepID=H3A2Y1_LATCH